MTLEKARVCIIITLFLPTLLLATNPLNDMLAETAVKNFKSSLTLIKEEIADQIGDIQIEAYDFEQQTWIELVHFYAINTRIDGYSVEQLFPACVEEIQDSYSPSDPLQNVEEIITLDTCIFSNPVNVNSGGMQLVSLSEDPTVSDENPLGVTTIIYDPDENAL